MNAIYGRQSVDRPDSISIESQIDYCKYETRGEEYKIYSDKGYSGKNTDRPEFQQMMEHIKQGLIKKVIVYRLDRISRSILDFSKMMEFFQEYGVEFVSTTEKFDTSTPMGRAMLSICIVFAQLERETIQKRVTDAYAARSKMGFYMGGRVPYGFTKEPTVINGIKTAHYIEIPEEVGHLITIFELYAEPSTALSQITRHFRENKIKKTRGIEWSTPRISEILRNPIYVKADADIYNFYHSRGTEIVNPPEDFIGENGCYLYTKDTQKNKGANKNMSQYENMVLVLAQHKGFIESSTFIKCRLKAEQNTQIPNGVKNKKSWLSGKIKCAKCGYAVRYNKWKGVTVENEYFLCSEVSGNRRCEGFGTANKDVVESTVLSRLKEKVKKMDFERSKPNRNQTEINKIKGMIAGKEKEIQEVLGQLKGANASVMKYINASVEELDADILSLKKELLQKEAENTIRSSVNIDEIQNSLKSWSKLTIEQQQAIADAMIQKVSITKNTVDVMWMG